MEGFLDLTVIVIGCDIRGTAVWNYVCTPVWDVVSKVIPSGSTRKGLCPKALYW